MKKYNDELELDERLEPDRDKRKYLVYGIVAFLILVAAVFLLRPKKEEQGTSSGVVTEKETEVSTLTEKQDTENAEEISQSETAETEEGMELSSEISTEISTELSAEVTAEPVNILISSRIAETKEETYGIDVAKYQGVIDWAKVAKDGIDFAMIRVGHRTMESGEIIEDEMAQYNLQEAAAQGIKLGVYFFSTAVTKEEALQEADWVADFIAKYPITYPVAYDCEGFDKEGNRHFNLTKEERTQLACAFMDRIYEHGYTPMFYGSKSELTDDLKWNTSQLEKRYKVWVSQYSAAQKSDYTGLYAMWQSTNQGSVAGIDGNVDLNIAYFGYAGTAQPISGEAPEIVEADVEVLMNFEAVNETVTAKNVTNLRDIPSQGEDSTVMVKLSNGDKATRTGISASGWSRVEYQGKTYYAVSSYLTTDLSAPPQQDVPADDGIETEFTACSETVTAKIEVNLRSLPSVTHPGSQVAVVLHHGETVTRTGINHDHGWSRVDYNGQTLYCVSSYLQLVP